MRFRLITTSIIDAEPILIKYPQLKDKVEIVDGDAYVEVESTVELMELAKLQARLLSEKISSERKNRLLKYMTVTENKKE